MSTIRTGSLKLMKADENAPKPLTGEQVFREVDRYREMKLREAQQARGALEAWHKRCEKLGAGQRRPPRPPRPLSGSSINKTLILLGAILDVAEERELIDRNPMRMNPKRRKLREQSPTRTLIDRADHLEAVLRAAGQLDKEEARQRGQCRPLIATLMFAGLRIGELLDLRWGDVDLARGTIIVRASKTEAGRRTVDVLAALRDELLTYRAAIASADRGALVFASGAGTRQSESNVRSRVLLPTFGRADEMLAEAGEDPLPTGLTAHSMRRTFASVLVALGNDPAHVMAQMGHRNPTMTLGVYAREMRRRDGEHDRLRALVAGTHWAPIGHQAGDREGETAATHQAQTQESPANTGLSGEADEGTRTLDLLHGKQTL